jgi:hypothetical protein
MGFPLNDEGRHESDFPKGASGHFMRPASPFRNWITLDGAPGPSGAGGYAAKRRSEPTAPTFARLHICAYHSIGRWLQDRNAMWSEAVVRLRDVTRAPPTHTVSLR